jgi:hypothetical protein
VSNTFSENREMNTYSLGKTGDKTHVEITLIWLGRDLLVKISGGETHFGSLAFSCQSEGNILKYQQHTYPAHREDRIVKQCIERLIELVPSEILVICGIHYDDISKEQIKQISDNCSFLIEKIARDLSKL